MDTSEMSVRPDPDQEKAPLVEHLIELRSRMIYSVVALIISFAICYFFVEEIYQFLLSPLADIYEGEENRRLIYTGLTEAFFTYVKLAFMAGFMLVFPIIAWQFYAFLAPGLYKNERRVLSPFLMLSPILFLLGAAMAYYFVFPLAWKFFLSFETLGATGELPIQLEAKISEYMSLVSGLILGFGLSFQLPVVLILLAKVGFIGSEWLKKKRRYALVGIAMLAAIMTPPDVISQIGLAIPLILLYEGSILAIKGIEKERIKEENA